MFQNSCQFTIVISFLLIFLINNCYAFVNRLPEILEKNNITLKEITINLSLTFYTMGYKRAKAGLDLEKGLAEIEKYWKEVFKKYQI